MSEIEFTDFQLDSIPTFLKANKEKIINMDLTLDRYEVSKSLTISLNRMLMGDKTKLSDIYNSMINNFEDTKIKIKLIEDKIKYFNSEQKFEYFVDGEKILYLVFYKQIQEVRKIIRDIHDYLESNINLVFIYSYLISKLYINKPNDIVVNYIFIINKIIQDISSKSIYDEELKKFLNPQIIDKIFIIIQIIYNADIDFIKLLSDLDNEKINAYKKRNSIDYSNTYKELEKEVKSMKGGDINISDIEIKFQKKKDYILMQKRKIDINILTDNNNLNMILQNCISIELWFGYNLFIYKRFEFNFEEYKTKINKLLDSKEFEPIYHLGLNFINDIDAPDAGILLMTDTNTLPIVGGYRLYKDTNNYYTKYIKYKHKYIQFKKNLKNKI